MATQTVDSTTPQPQIAIPIVDSTRPEPQLPRAAQYKSPNLDFLADTRKAMDDFIRLCVPLYKLALKGNWPEAKLIIDKDDKLKHAAIARGYPTVLHIAAGASAGANHVHFVEELLKMMDEDHVALRDIKGNTAFCFAAAAGNSRIAELMLQKNPVVATIRGGDGMTPVQFAALQGRCKMASDLYGRTKDEFEDEDWVLLFFTCINTANYELAIKMLRDREDLAFARDEKEQGLTGLHLLARKPNSYCPCPDHQIMFNPDLKQQVLLQLVKLLWETILSKSKSKSEIITIISQPSHVLFDATEVGNFGFLSELISAYPNLIWEVDNRNRSIIHIAVLHRHASIYNLIHEIGSQKDIIMTYEDDTDKNTLLHLAAKLAPPSQLELVSGAAFQMSRELLWFEEVKHRMPPSLIDSRNSEGLTASELFTKEHAELRKHSERWMKGTAKSCMLVSTVIATAVFSSAITLPGGNENDLGRPNYLGTTPFLLFAISDATALISSATATLIFLSILVSRYAEYDFHKSLPLKLISGLISLFISIISMMVAFGSAFFITYYYDLKWVPSFVSVFAGLPALLFMVLQYPLWSEIIYSTYYCRTLFKPGMNMLYV